MCKLLSVINVKNSTILNCTPYNGDFLKASKLYISSSDGDILTIADFEIRQHGNCFTSGPATPWVAIKNKIPENFLQVGNKVEFGY